jgi:hypothetical protein
MNKVKTLLITTGLVFLASAFAWYSFFGKLRLFPPKTSGVNEVQESPATAAQNRLYLSIIFDSGNEINYEKTLTANSSTSAFDLLKEALDANQITYETKAYDFGIFVQSINGQVSGADKSWIYFVNGASGQVAADKYILNPGDKVEWKYITPSE